MYYWSDVIALDRSLLVYVYAYEIVLLLFTSILMYMYVHMKLYCCCLRYVLTCVVGILVVNQLMRGCSCSIEVNVECVRWA